MESVGIGVCPAEGVYTCKLSGIMALWTKHCSIQGFKAQHAFVILNFRFRGPPSVTENKETKIPN